MKIRKRIALAISGLAVAGFSALTLGTANPAGAQTATVASHQTTISNGCWGYYDDCGYGWDDDWDYGGWYGW
jgi:hypothetical protein